MNVKEYMPTTAEVQYAYAATRCDGSDDHETDSACVADFGFNRWLQEQILRVRASAWDEGYRAAVVNVGREQLVAEGRMLPEVCERFRLENPYRKDKK